MSSFVLATCVKDLRAHLRDPYAFLLWLGVPLAIGGLLTLGLGGSSGPKPRSPLYVDDRDGSFASRALSRAFEGGALGDFFEVRALDEVAARTKLASDDGSALVVIPEGFGKALIDDEPTRIQLVENPAQRILPGIVEQTLSILPDAAFYLHRVFSPELRAMFDSIDDDRGPTDEQVLAISLSIKRAIERVDKIAFPPVVKLTTVDSSSKSDGGSNDFGRLFFPSMCFMALFFMSKGLSQDLWVEKSQGALRRLASSPRGFGSFFLGKSLAVVALTLFVALVALAIGAAAFGFELARLPLALLWLGASGSMFYGLFALVQVACASQRSADVYANVILFPLLMLGGSFFPFEAMPDWMASLGKWTPNGWALTELKAILDGKLAVGAAALQFLIAGGICSVLFQFIVLRLRGAFPRS